MKPRIPASRKSGGSRVASGQRHQPQENNSINDSASTAASGKDSFMATAAELRKPIPMISHDGPIEFLLDRQTVDPVLWLGAGATSGVDSDQTAHLGSDAICMGQKFRYRS